MGLRDLLRPRPAGVRKAAREVSLVKRLREVLQPPPMPNRYVAPELRRVEGVLFVLRGYRVLWTEARIDAVGDDGRTMPNPSVLVYSAVVRGYEPWDGPAVELPTVFPGEAHRLVSWAQSARHIGWHFTRFQVERELGWILQRRKSRGRGGYP